MHKDRIYRLLIPLLGLGLVTSEGDHWKRNRRLAAPSLSRRHVAGYADIMVECAEDWAAAQPHGAELTFQSAMMSLTQRVVLATLFGMDAQVDDQAVGHAIEVFMAEFSHEAQGRRRVLPSWVPTPGRARATRSVARLDALLFPLIEARRAQPEGDDLLSRLMLATDEDGQQLSDTELRDEMVTLFVAGHETTSLALTYAVGLLCQHPEAMARLVAEVDSVLAGRSATIEDMAALPYTDAVIKETMRVFPPVWAIGRETLEDLVIDGVRLPQGAQIVVAQWVLHRDARWFTDPLAFRPERWLDGLEERLPRHAYMPFGGGPRVCIGNHFAIMEAVLLLATVVARLELVATTPFPPRLLPSVTLRPIDPVGIRVRRRP
jgi:cytochrome P450